jgi:hypothetical protein
MAATSMILASTLNMSGTSEKDDLSRALLSRGFLSLIGESAARYAAAPMNRIRINPDKTTTKNGTASGKRISKCIGVRGAFFIEFFRQHLPRLRRDRCSHRCTHGTFSLAASARGARRKDLVHE